VELFLVVLLSQECWKWALVYCRLQQLEISLESFCVWGSAEHPETELAQNLTTVVIHMVLKLIA